MTGLVGCTLCSYHYDIKMVNTISQEGALQIKEAAEHTSDWKLFLVQVRGRSQGAGRSQAQASTAARAVCMHATSCGCDMLGDGVTMHDDLGS